MAHEKVYGVCENKCFVEVPSKEEIEEEFDGKVSKAGDTMTGRLKLEMAGKKTPLLINNTTSDGSGTFDDFTFQHLSVNQLIQRFNLSTESWSYQFRAHNKTGESVGIPLTIGWNPDDGIYASAVKPSNSADNSTRIATTEWVNKALSLIHTTGNEVKSGTLTLKDGLVVKDKISAIQIQHSVIPSNGYPPETIQPTISLNDAGGKLRCNVCLGARVNDIHAMLRVYDTLGNWKDMGLKYDESIKRFITFVPTPPITGYLENEIATVNWTDARIQAIPSETWTFTLEDGSTVTKKVLVG